MPMTPQRERTILMIVVALIVVVLVGVAYFSPDEDIDDQSLSTYSSHSGGAKATFMLLRQLSPHVDRWSLPPADLPKAADGVLLIIGQPVRLPEVQDRTAMNSFLNRGGTILFTGNLSWRFLPESAAIPTIPPQKAWHQFPAMKSGPLTTGVPEITMTSKFHWIGFGYGKADLLYGTKDKPVVVAYHVGKGRIIWLGSQVPLSNVGLKGKGNVEFLANVVKQSGFEKVLWDTYFTEEVAGPKSAFNSLPVKVAFAQVMFVFALVLWTHSRRFGPVRQFAGSEGPKAQLEFVRTLASLYRSAKAANVALEISYQRFLFLAKRRLALPPSPTPENVADVLSAALRLPPEEVRRVLIRCEEGRGSHELTSDEAQELMAHLHEYLTKLKVISQTESKSKEVH